jgi:hypothetical protein
MVGAMFENATDKPYKRRRNPRVGCLDVGMAMQVGLAVLDATNARRAAQAAVNGDGQEARQGEHSTFLSVA